MKRIWITLSMIISSILAFWALQAQAEWKIDLSRRQKQLREHEMRAMAPEKKTTFLQKIFAGGGPMNDIVILNTEKGFVPQTLRLRKGISYTVHVVNVNKKEKNISFMLDAFSEHHATYYGNIKSFQIEPQKEGIFSYQCPETSSQGRMVVVNPGQGNTPTYDMNEMGLSMRKPASRR